MKSISRIISGFNSLISHNTVISISGSSGTGKSTLAQYLVGNYTLLETSIPVLCFWLQASQKFSKNRLKQLFGRDLERYSRVKESIFVSPREKPCSSYLEQSTLLIDLISKQHVFPNFLKFLVIDNISCHLRAEILNAPSFESKMHLQDDFFDDQLSKLVFMCFKMNVKLVLIHEMSYNPKKNENLPFLSNMYDRLGTTEFILESTFRKKYNMLTIKTGNFKKLFKFRIINEGFDWLLP